MNHNTDYYLEIFDILHIFLEKAQDIVFSLTICYIFAIIKYIKSGKKEKKGKLREDRRKCFK